MGLGYDRILRTRLATDGLRLRSDVVPGEHVFVDETKRGGLLFAAAVVAPSHLQPMRTLMRGQLLRGQSHLHFTKEKDDRRGEIVKVLCASGVQVDVYQAAHGDPRKAREACLRRLVADLASTGAHRLVIEQDDSLIKSDQAVLYSAVRQAQVEDTLTYAHLPKRSEPLLWIADAVAWCWTHQGWKARIQPVINTVHMVP